MGAGASCTDGSETGTRPRQITLDVSKKESTGTIDAARRNEQIEKFLMNDQMKQQRMVKLLLLGGGESGKSTFAKQMRILHLDGFSQSDLVNYRKLVHSNTACSMHQLLQGISALMIPPDGITYSDVQNFQLFANSSNNFDCALTPEVGTVMQRIWDSPAAKEAYDRRVEFDLMDSAQYFLNNLGRTCSSGYIPTHEDVLRTRAHTTGINEIRFQLRGFDFNLVDVGGQRTERRKWIHCFDNVTAVLFLSSLSEYDQALAEDSSANRLQDSLALFSFIANNPYFTHAAILLFLNKKDIFQEKIPKSPLDAWLPGYKGPKDDYRAAREHILTEFVAKTPAERKLYSYYTTATDTKNIEVVFSASIDVILNSALGNVGFN